MLLPGRSKPRPADSLSEFVVVFAYRSRYNEWHAKGAERMQFLQKLSNGMIVTGEHMNTTPAVSMGFWIRTGGMNEAPGESGISHFLEHISFKGTPTRTARDIAVEMDEVGGTLNAFTTKEETCFYVKVAQQHIGLGLNLLTDILYHSLMDGDFIEREKSVVLDEIAQADDSPEDRVHELLYECYYKGHPLAQPVLGAKRVISSLTREKLVDFRRAHYAWDNTVFSIAGSFDEKTVFEALEGIVPGSAQETSAPLPQAHRRGGERTVRYDVKSVEQLHIALAFPGVERDHRLMIAINVLNNIVGGGMSSRLFQTLREELGLVYGIFTYPVYHSCGGMVVVDTGTIDRNGPQVLEKIREEIRRIVADGVTEEEFTRAREQLRGNFILSREGIESRMSGGGRSVLFYGRRRTEQETLERIDRVTRDDVMEAARTVFDFDRMAAAFVGRKGGKKSIEGMLEAW